MNNRPDRQETAELEAEFEGLVNRLRGERPIPRPAYRGNLGRHITQMGQSNGSIIPRAVKVRIAGFFSSGVALLAVALAGVLGGGPLA